MEFCSGKPDNPAASVMDYCTGVLMLLLKNNGSPASAAATLAAIQ